MCICNFWDRCIILLIIITERYLYAIFLHIMSTYTVTEVVVKAKS